MKNDRQNHLLQIITEESIETQEQLLERLQARGIKSTQATISRDIKELRIVKELTGLGTYRYTTTQGEVTGTFSSRMNNIFRECVTGFDYAQNMIVIHTLPGSAHVAAEAIDNLRWAEVLGTIAGDNTILVIVRSNEEVDAVIKRFGSIIR